MKPANAMFMLRQYPDNLCMLYVCFSTFNHENVHEYPDTANTQMPFGNITCIHANKTMPFISVYDRPIHAHTLLPFLYVAAPRYALVLSHWGIPSEGMLQRLGGDC